MSPTTTTGRHLLQQAALTPIEIEGIDYQDSAPDGAIRVALRIDGDDVDTAAFGLVFALGVLSFDEARPRGASDIEYEEQDEWSTDDMLQHLEFSQGRLRFYADYVRGRMMKTSIEVHADGRVVLQVVNRGRTAERWVGMLQGRKHLGVVGLAEAGASVVFYGRDGAAILTLDDWKAQQDKEEHWKPGRSAMLLAQRWGAAGGLPVEFIEALDKEERLQSLNMVRGVVEHTTPTPGRGKDSTTDILVLAEDPLGNGVVIAVEGKVDEGFDKLLGEWLEAGKGKGSVQNRLFRAGRICSDLGLDVTSPEVRSLRYQLLHRAWAAYEEAVDRRATRAVFAVHSFLELGARGSGWLDFLALARAMASDRELPVPGAPWLADTLDGVELWLLWVVDG